MKSCHFSKKKLLSKLGVGRGQLESSRLFISKVQLSWGCEYSIIAPLIVSTPLSLVAIFNMFKAEKVDNYVGL